MTISLTPTGFGTLAEAGPDRRSTKAIDAGAPLLPARPLWDWLAQALRDPAAPPLETVTLDGGAPGTVARALRRSAQTGVLSERLIEHIGLIFGDPRLAATLYPRLAEPVCALCGADDGCRHLGDDLSDDDARSRG